MSSYTTQPTCTQTISAGLAAGLVHYAKQSSVFAGHLAGLPMNASTFSIELVQQPTPTWLIPTDDESALARLSWLQQELFLAPDEHLEAQAVLRHWREHQTDPKDVVLGIVGLAIIGPTLGIISRRKRKRSQMRILIGASTYQSLNEGERLQLIQTASTRMLANALAVVEGITDRLDPDLFDWLYSDQDIEVGTVPEHVLQEAELEALSQALPNETLYIEDQPIALAISPIVHREFFSQYAPTMVT